MMEMLQSSINAPAFVPNRAVRPASQSEHVMGVPLSFSMMNGDQAACTSDMPGGQQGLPEAGSAPSLCLSPQQAQQAHSSAQATRSIGQLHHGLDQPGVIPDAGSHEVAPRPPPPPSLNASRKCFDQLRSVFIVDPIQ